MPIDLNVQPFIRYITENAVEHNALMKFNGRRRNPASHEVTAPLQKWLGEHSDNPSPTKAEKMMLAIITKMSLKQVTAWFDNALNRMQKQQENGLVGAKIRSKI